MLLQLKRKILYWIGHIIGSNSDPYSIARHSFIEDSSMRNALDKFDQGEHDIAVEIFKRDADKGDLIAQYNLGICHEIGIGVGSISDKSAERLYRSAASKDVREAQYALSVLLAADIMAGLNHDLSTSEVESRLVEAHFWLNKAKALGHPEADTAISRLEMHMTPELLDRHFDPEELQS